MPARLLPLALAALLAPQGGVVAPVFRVAVWYAGPGASPPAQATDDLRSLSDDLRLIRRAGFNAVITWVSWRDAEPGPGAYVLAGTERLIATAAEADLDVEVRIFTNATPDWTGGDGAADAGRFVEYARRRLKLQPRVSGVERAESAVPPGRIRVGPGALTPPEARLALWQAVARGDRAISFIDAEGGVGPNVLALGETAGVITRNQALFAPLRPRDGGVRRIETTGGGAPVDVRLLESAEAIVIIGLNDAPAPRTLRVTFAPEIPEAIWQNLETGTSVSFVMGPDGPSLEHTFAPHDALVLMIRKRPPV